MFTKRKNFLSEARLSLYQSNAKFPEHLSDDRGLFAALCLSLGLTN